MLNETKRLDDDFVDIVGLQIHLCLSRKLKQVLNYLSASGPIRSRSSKGSVSNLRPHPHQLFLEQQFCVYQDSGQRVVNLVGHDGRACRLNHSFDMNQMFLSLF
jgi:hypothetical protein